MGSNWYEHFFNGVALDLWRKAATVEQTEAEVDFIESVLDCRPGAKILDVPCGNGRHSLEMAARGYRMTGVDIAEGFVREARVRSSAAGLDVEWLLGDMRNLPRQAEFDGAFCFGNCFGYLDNSGTLAFVAALSRALKPGARFAIDTAMAAESILPNLAERDWVQVDDILLLMETHYQVEDSRLDTEYTFVRDEKVETRTSLHWVYTVGEIRRMFAQVDLVTLAQWSSLDRQPFQLADPRLLLLAVKD